MGIPKKKTTLLLGQTCLSLTTETLLHTQSVIVEVTGTVAPPSLKVTCRI